MLIHGVPIIGEIREHKSSLAMIREFTTKKQWNSIKAIYLIYHDIHDTSIDATGCYVADAGGVTVLGFKNTITLKSEDSPCIVISGDVEDGGMFEYVLLHELGHHQGYGETDSDIFALTIMKSYYEEGLSFTLKEQPLADTMRQLGIKVNIVA